MWSHLQPAWTVLTALDWTFACGWRGQELLPAGELAAGAAPLPPALPPLCARRERGRGRVPVLAGQGACALCLLGVPGCFWRRPGSSCPGAAGAVLPFGGDALRGGASLSRCVAFPAVPCTQVEAVQTWQQPFTLAALPAAATQCSVPPPARPECVQLTAPFSGSSLCCL